jgi:hypothetical protein
MNDPVRLQGSFEENSQLITAEARHDHAYRHMLALAELFTGWALDGRLGPERSASLLGWAEGWERLAGEVGPGWNPPEPEELSVLQFLARNALAEPTAGRTPKDRAGQGKKPPPCDEP